MVTGAFQLARIPPVRFGAGRLAQLPETAAALGRRALLVTGASSLRASGRLEAAIASLEAAGISVRHVAIEGEPSTAFIDSARDSLRDAGLDLVIGIGGGSVIDGAKALSAMLPHRNSVLEHLEDVGSNRPHSGVKLPFVAVPTTSGTGGEMTKNAVLSRVGRDGYKKSLRHDSLIPDAVIVDPELMLSCPRGVTAACGMDALTQLLEPFLSPASSPAVDSLVVGALERVRDCLLPACGGGAGDVEVRAGMAYASMISGIALANAGLGIVHGLASPVGGFFPVPHGVVCGTLVAEATAANLAALRAEERAGGAPLGRARRALARYAEAGRILAPRSGRGSEAADGDALVERLREWIEALQLPRLGAFGIAEGDLDRIAGAAHNRNNPVQLNRQQILAVLAARL